ncbi:hypothetical protein ACLOJK_024170, partial [Asimina triloba]
KPKGKAKKKKKIDLGLFFLPLVCTFELIGGIHGQSQRLLGITHIRHRWNDHRFAAWPAFNSFIFISHSSNIANLSSFQALMIASFCCFCIGSFV